MSPLDAVYAEAHGTGTSLGDPIEIVAMGRAMRGSGTDGPSAKPHGCAKIKNRGDVRKLVPNSVEGCVFDLETLNFSVLRPVLQTTSFKSNIGHLECGAGAASLAKLMLVLQQSVIPPSLHLKVFLGQLSCFKGMMYVCMSFFSGA